MPAETADRRAARVTVGLGAGVPRMFKDVRVVIDYDRGLIELWSSDDFSHHLATAPLVATLVEWEVAPATKHKIVIVDDAAPTRAAREPFVVSA